jgi:hypothetical protein
MTRLRATARAQLVAWRGELRRTRGAAVAGTRLRSRELLVFGGFAGMLGGAYLAGGLRLVGVTLMAQSLFAIYVGLNRDDGARMPARGARTAQQVLDDERLRE